MRNEIKVARDVFKSCDEFQNCTQIKPARAQPHSVNFTTHQMLTTTEFVQIMDENYGACSNPDQPYTRVKNWMETGTLGYDHCKYKGDLVKNFKLD